MWVRMMMLAWLAVSLAGCGIKIGTECDWAEPIRPSRADILTPGTQRQILAHNETGSKLCGWQP